MSLIDKLTDKEKEMIGTYIDRYACNETARTATVEHILRFWDEAKSKYLARLFNGQLTITKDITFKQDVQETEEEVRKAIMHNPEANKFVGEWRDKFGWFEWSDTDIIDRVTADCLYRMMDWDFLVSNTWTGRTFTGTCPDGTIFKVQNGTKISKAIGKIAKGFGMSELGYEAFRIACSQGLNQKTLRGELTLSIHPLDYMTMSDNESDWTSCMSWWENGCYRQGTVEMMNSPMVIVAYLAAKDAKVKINGNEWNSKKWRELLIITPEMICNVLGYPYRNTFLSQAAVSMVRDLAENHLEWNYENREPVIWQQENHFNPFNDDFQTYIYTETYHMYNDFSDRDHFGFFNRGIGNEYVLHYSGKAECMCCGCEDPEIDEESYLVGSCCEVYEYCDMCGERIYSDSEVYWVDDQRLCQFCYDDRVITDIEDEEHLSDNCKKITLLSYNNTSVNDCVYIYEENWNWKYLFRYFYRLYGLRENPWYYNEKYYVYLEDLTEYGLRAFSLPTGCDTIEEYKERFENRYRRWAEEHDLSDAKIYDANKELPAFY